MKKNFYDVESYWYDLPDSLIAQQPAHPRDHSRLMVIDRASGQIIDKKFFDLPEFLQNGDQIIFNNSKVFPCRLNGLRKGGGKAEIFLIKERKDVHSSRILWEGLVRPGRKMTIGCEVHISNDLQARIIDVLENGNRLVEFHSKKSFADSLKTYGQIPLPGYIHGGIANEIDIHHYQTVYAEHQGSVAAPTAGLHFTNSLLDSLKSKGVNTLPITLHVGVGTFRPVKTKDIRHHHMHKEEYFIYPDDAYAMNNLDVTKRQICVGTTTCRSLESNWSENTQILPGHFQTDIFIYPGYQFQYVRQLLTNFHLPGSSLLMLVSAFAGYELIKEAYQKAVKDRYRFFSYGDAMLII